MVERLKSYLAGRWVEGSGSEHELIDLIDPTTEDVLATACTDGLDLIEAVRFARTAGASALSHLTFAERGKLLAAMAKCLHQKREAFLDLSTQSGGNTRSDAKFDLDGATGTLGYYAALGEKLGQTTFLKDGDAEPMGRNPRYVGQHFWHSRRGVALHINAFNFPAWGFAEKAAVALLAGVPVVTKPATSTALLACRMVETLAEARVLPNGALSLIAGSVPASLIDDLQTQDVLAFTGSLQTALGLRLRGALVERGVRIHVEADSLNSALLCDDVERSGPTYDLFVREVCRDVTQKAGQKCTAIRRVLVPQARLDEVRDDLVAVLSATRVGDPRLKEVQMGPVATREQLAHVREGLAAYRAYATSVLSDGARGQLVGVSSERGYFVAPTVLVARDAGAPALHSREIFGPVVTLFGYDDVAEATTTINASGGSLVSSVYCDRASQALEAARQLAPFHGRLHLASEKISELSVGPGTVMPQLVHGGPGRAGAGEELGGLRALSLYMQRTAIAGYQPWLD